MSESTVKKDEMRFGTKRPKVPAFARFRGTSAFKQFRLRAREYAKFKAAERTRAVAAA